MTVSVKSRTQWQAQERREVAPVRPKVQQQVQDDIPYMTCKHLLFYDKNLRRKTARVARQLLSWARRRGHEWKQGKVYLFHDFWLNQTTPTITFGKSSPKLCPHCLLFHFYKLHCIPVTQLQLEHLPPILCFHAKLSEIIPLLKAKYKSYKQQEIYSF